MAKDKRRKARSRARKKARHAAKRQQRKQQQISRSGRFVCLGCSRRELVTSPIYGAMISTTIFTQGIGPVIIARELPDGRIAAGTFLVDAYCLGVKDAFLKVTPKLEYLEDIEEHGVTGEPAPPARARKLIEDAIAYARDLGFAPHPDFREAAVVFGNIDARDCPDEFTFGHDGKPLFVTGPYDSPGRVRQVLTQLDHRCGPNGFSFIVGSGDFSPEDWEDVADETEVFDEDEFDADEDGGTWSDAGYDPLQSPDLASWEAIDEMERLEMIAAYHRREQPDLPNAELHVIFHVMVENQALMADLPVAATIARLMRQGLDRHDAVHAVGSIAVRHMYTGMRDQKDFDRQQYQADLEALTPESWGEPVDDE